MTLTAPQALARSDQLTPWFKSNPSFLSTPYRTLRPASTCLFYNLQGEQQEGDNYNFTIYIFAFSPMSWWNPESVGLIGRPPYEEFDQNPHQQIWTPATRAWIPNTLNMVFKRQAIRDIWDIIMEDKGHTFGVLRDMNNKLYRRPRDWLSSFSFWNIFIDHIKLWDR